MSLSPRTTAVRILLQIFSRRTHLGDLSQNTKFLALDARDKAFTYRLLYSVVQGLSQFDYLISRNSSIRLEKLDEEIKAILRCAICELCNFRTPSHAVVNESVKICGILGKKSASGFVNAVLRNHLRSKNPLPDGDDIESIAVRYSHPTWLVRRYLDRHGPIVAEQIMEKHNREPKHYLWVNPFKTSLEGVCSQLERDNLEFERVEGFPSCLRLATVLTGHPIITEGLGFFMSLESQSIVAAMNLSDCLRIADICAAPGGKSFLMAYAIQSSGQVYASDISLNRLTVMRRRAQLLAVPNLNFVQADLIFTHPYRRTFDIVLLDAPCSGLATLAENPEIRWTFEPSSFDRMYKRQLSLLRTAFNMLGKGGQVVYSTCSSEPEENEQVIEQFLEEEPRAKREDFQGNDISLGGVGRCFFLASIRRI